MKILFITIGQIQSLEEKSVHIDIIKALRAAGHKVSVCATREKRLGLPTMLAEENGIKILRLRIGNLTRCSIVEKGINTLLVEKTFIRALKKYFKDDEFDLVIYNTPPITLANVVKYCKRKYGCASYLMLKDIFPQNALDLKMMSESGVTGLMYRLFRRMEIALYKVSDRIGCMSKKNVEYLLEHNPYISADKTEIFPNAVFEIETQPKDRSVLESLGIDGGKLTFLYGGNLGKPQGLDFLSEALNACKEQDCNFLIIGSGQEKEKFYRSVENAPNVFTFDYLPHEEYNKLCAACDVGLIMLDRRFTIPNYPSRILTYMENAVPVLACTDRATDIRELVTESAKCGKWCCSDDVRAFTDTVKWFIENRQSLAEMGNNGLNYLRDNFVTDICVKKLENFMADKEKCNV